MDLMGKSLEQKDFVLTVRDDSPVVITVPHDGTLPKQYFRGLFTERIRDVDRDIRIGRDKHVFPIVKDLLLRVPVNVVYAMIHRAYIDFNRPADIGVGDSDLMHIYDRYHAEISKLILRCKKKHGYCLLLDFHGCANITKPGMENTDLILGTNDRRSVFSDVDLELERWLANRGYKVLVANDEIFQGLFTGRYNVIDYSKRFQVDSILIEITGQYRAKGSELVGVKLANDLAEFIRDHVSRK